MSEERQETIADVVADIRAQNQGLPEDSYALSPLVCDLLSFADRIEAAAKRERAQVGNAEKMLEALQKIVLLTVKAEMSIRFEVACGIIASTARCALSAHPRNCDVGTPEEQSARFDAHCRKHMGCLTCPLREKDGGVPKHCEFAWSQMPYEEED